MSGIVALSHPDGAPVDRELLHTLTRFMAYRGPDGDGTWVGTGVGLGHSLLRTTDEARWETQPCSLDGQVWITADARIDDRAGLIAKLPTERRHDARTATDAKLILHAYDVWGEDCVRHLLGDFAVAIWDGRRRRLFCARDHLGVKPLYHARLPAGLVVSNTLDCLRQHPAVPDDLDDAAIGDFLLFGYNHDMATTTFSGIRRLPPGHTLTFGAEGLRLRRYWEVPADAVIVRYRDPTEYVEHFRDLLGKAVRDRLRTDRVAIWMSGGLDSPTLAATLRQVSRHESVPCDVRAFCMVYETLIPDEERRYADLVARAIEVPIEFLVADGYRLFDRIDAPNLYRPEPVENALLAQVADLLAAASGHARVVFNGEDPDALLAPATVIDMLQTMPAREVIRDVAGHVVATRSRPPLGLGVRRRLNALLGRTPPRLPYPRWLNPDFERRLALRARWRDVMDVPVARVRSPRRNAYRRLTTPFLSTFLASVDPGVTRYPAELRFPYLDVRLVEYALRLPPLPWCVRKRVLRGVATGLLPDETVRRPKTPLRGSPWLELVRRGAWGLTFHPSAYLAEYVKLPIVVSATDRSECWADLRPIAFDRWLRSLDHSTQTACRERAEEVVRP